ncbi:PQQ-binding-like beta-propeller repeat protein [Dactylosporangium sp. NBC_01737]|uniref:outer membrane protein assembly factor BamB family protein n=1 Tax=Dactylosporangium sp. NBC_01737 TaxID=2975959 RepID=UPI002E145121|nr:PQQ-binding-like beta-propeller repeat protein [Dactylosporangium sp. NBC_01737]
MISRMAAVAAACVTGALLATPAAPAGAATPGNWPQHGGGAANDNHQPGTGGLDVRRQLWQRQAGGDDTVGGAAVAGGALTVAYGKGALRRMDVRTGAVTVVGKLAGRRPQQLADVDGALYVRSLDADGTRSRLASYDRAGTRRWEVALPDDDAILPFTVAGGHVLVTSGPKCRELCTGYHLRAYRTRNGTLAWSGAVDGDAGGAPAVAGDVVVQGAYGPVRGTGDGSGGANLLFAFDLRTGVRQWTRIRPGFSLVGHRGSLLVSGAGPQALCSLDPATGAARWCRDTPVADEWVDGLSAGGGAVFGYGLTGTVRRYHPATGATAWSAPLALPGYEYNALHAPLVSGGGLVYAAVRHGNFTPSSEFTEIVVLRATDGHVVRRLRLAAYEDASAELMLASGRLLLVGDRTVRAFG